MSQTILQINFKFNMPPEEYIEMVRPVAEPIARFNGCQWKVWLINEAEQEAGGIYLFHSAEAAQAYLDSSLVASLASHPKLSEVNVKLFANIDELTDITRGPIWQIQTTDTLSLWA